MKLFITLLLYLFPKLKYITNIHLYGLTLNLEISSTTIELLLLVHTIEHLQSLRLVICSAHLSWCSIFLNVNTFFNTICILLFF
jgi:hypothetical protein